MSPTERDLGDEIYTAEVAAYDIDGAVATTLYYSTGLGFSSRPTDTPANQFFDARIRQPLDVGRVVFAPGSTSGTSKIGFGDLVLLNDDGGLDDLIGYAFDGRDITIRRGLQGDTYPANFTTVFAGTMEQPEESDTNICLLYTSPSPRD